MIIPPIFCPQSFLFFLFSCSLQTWISTRLFRSRSLSSPTMLLFAILLAGIAEAQFGGFGGLAHLRFGCSQLTIERLDP